VLVCSLHGTRYGRFKCAMCEAARSALAAMSSSDGGDGPEVAQARLVGAAATPAQRDGVSAAQHRIAEDHERARRFGLVAEDRPRTCVWRARLDLPWCGSAK
jgi:hypothetical protein